MGNCVEKLNRLTTTVRDQKYFDTMIGADNVKDNKNRLCSRIGSGADHPKKELTWCSAMVTAKLESSIACASANPSASLS